MRCGRSSARAQSAPGRFARSIAVGALLLGACQTVGGPIGSGGSQPTGPAPLVVQPGPITGGEESAAAELYAAAEGSFEARRFFEVIRTTDELLERFPQAQVSGEALWLSAQASFETGDLAAADAKAEQYVGLMAAGDDRAPAVRLFQAAAFPDSLPARLDRLLQIGDGASPGVLVEAGQRVRQVADSLPPEALSELLAPLEGRGPLVPVADARLSVTLLEFGRTLEAEQYASRALGAGVVGEDRSWAEGVLLGELPEGRGRERDFRIGVVLPLSGPPALAEFAQLVAEGIEVAATTVLGEEYTVDVLVRDDEANPTRTAELVAELDAEGVHGIIGMLQDDDLLNAGSSRSREIPLVSPTARSADRAGPSVYSLEGADTEAATAVARYAVTRAFQRIAIILPQTPEAEAEASAFERVAASLGMPVVGRFPYEAGATFFEPQIRAARNALRAEEIAALNLAEDDTLHMELFAPAAIFLPIPAEDVEFLAPQAIHFGLDTLAIELLGTTGWTDPGVLDVVDSRLTTGIVATAAVGVREGTEGSVRFRDDYEEYFQRSLVGSTPSIGFDAALLLLEALRPGRVAPDQLRSAFDGLTDVDGATGIFSVVNQRVSRRTELVRIQDRVPVPIFPDTVVVTDSSAVPDTIGPTGPPR